MPIYRVATPGGVNNYQSTTTERYVSKTPQPVTLNNPEAIQVPHNQSVLLRHSRPTDGQNANSATVADASNQNHADQEKPLQSAEPQQQILKGRRMFDCDSFIIKEFEDQQRREEEWRQQRSRPTLTTTGGSDIQLVVRSDAVDDRQRQTADSTKPLVRVQPYEDSDADDVDDDQRYHFITPHKETVIEREVRINRLRDGSMRRVHGYPAFAPSRDVAVEVNVDQTRLSPRETRPAGDVGDDDDVAMRRIATNRLKAEILRERQRELDLRNQGKISTISEERIGQPILLAELEHRLENGKQQQQQQQQRQRTAQMANNVAGSTPGNRQQQVKIDGLKMRKPTENQLKQTKTVGERLIEEEIRELRRREEELREQRKLSGPTSESKQSSSIHHSSSYGRI